MKKFEEFTSKDLWQLRNEIIVNSLFIGDYRNSFGISKMSVFYFFDGWVDYIASRMNENNPDYNDRYFMEHFPEYNTEECLWEWYNCHEDFSWMEYDPE